MNFSRWFGPLEVAVAELGRDGAIRPYPNAAFNGTDVLISPMKRAISVQSVVTSDNGRSLWIVDAGNPQLTGVIPGGAKLIEVDLSNDRVKRVFPLGPSLVTARSYLADVRIDAKRNIAYMPDLAQGAIAVLDLSSGMGWRHLEHHVSTMAEDLLIQIDGRPWLYADGSRPRTAATSIALSPDGATLYFKALVGSTLYAVPAASLASPRGRPEDSIRAVARCHPSDAMNFGPDGALYLTAIDRQAITRWVPGQPEVTPVVVDPRLAWPVGLAFDSFGRGYTTIGRIHEGDRPKDRYRLFSFELPSRSR